MKRLKILLAVVCLLSATCFVFACGKKTSSNAGGSAKALPSPNNLQIENFIAKWDEVKSAVKYKITVNKKEFETKICEYDFSSEKTDGISAYYVSVVAVGDGIKNGDSRPAIKTYIIKAEKTTPNLAYYSINNGSEYAVSRGKATKADMGERIVIPDFYKGKPVTEIVEKGFYYNTVTVSGGATAKGNYWTKSVKLPKKLKVIGDRAFDGMTALEDVEIPDSVTYIGEYAFDYCPLKKVEIPSGLTVINKGVFFHTQISELNLKNVTEIGDGAFSMCNNIKEVDLSKVKKLGTSFRNCKKLEKITLPETFETLGRAFEGTPWENALPNGVNCLANYVYCVKGKLESEILDLSGKEYSGITGIVGYIFDINNCKDLRFLNLSENITKLERHAFNSCSNLMQVKLGKQVELIDEYAFNGCFRVFEIYNMSKIEITAGAGENGGIARFARIIHKNAEEQSVFTLTSDGYYFMELNENGEDKAYLVTAVEKKSNSLVLPQSVNLNGKIYNEYGIAYVAFSGFGYFDCVNLGNAVTSIEAGAFNDCFVSEFVMGDGITSFGISCLPKCIVRLTIGKNVTEIVKDTVCRVYEICNLSKINLSLNSTYYNYLISSYTITIGSSTDERAIEKVAEDVYAYKITDGEEEKICVFAFTEKLSLVLPESFNFKGKTVTNYIMNKKFNYANAPYVDEDGITRKDVCVRVVAGNSLTEVIENEIDYQYTYILYKGSEEEWENNPCRVYMNGKSLKVYYYSETPDCDNYYWHYDENGNAVIWNEK